MCCRYFIRVIISVYAGDLLDRMPSVHLLPQPHLLPGWRPTSSTRMWLRRLSRWNRSGLPSRSKDYCSQLTLTYLRSVTHSYSGNVPFIITAKNCWTLVVKELNVDWNCLFQGCENSRFILKFQIFCLKKSFLQIVSESIWNKNSFFN